MTPPLRDITDEPVFDGLPLFVLIDPFFGEPAVIGEAAQTPTDLAGLSKMRERLWDRAVAIDDAPLPLLPSPQLPYVVELEGADDPWLPALVDLTAAQHAEAIETRSTRISVGAFLQSDLALPQVLAYVRAMSTQSIDGRPRHLRVAAPRVMDVLSSVLGLEYVRHWLGPLRHWQHVERNAGWCRLESVADGLASQDSEMPLARAKLVLDTHQRRLLAQSEVACRALDAAQSEGLIYEPHWLDRALALAVAPRIAAMNELADVRAMQCARVLLAEAASQHHHAGARRA